MDPIKNPFSPGAGAPPPELVGREQVLRQAQILFGRVRQGKAEKSLLLTGLRGVGKTVLLNEMAREATRQGYEALFSEAHEDKPLVSLLAPQLRNLLYKLDRMEGAKDKVRRALAVLKGFVGSVKLTFGDFPIGIDLEPEKGSADSGDLEIDLPDLLLAVAEAAQAREVAVAILIDEIQYFGEKELSALIMSMHRMQQRQLPLVLLGAGLPILPRLAGESKSYAERLFAFPAIGALGREDARKALEDPVTALDVHYENGALEEIVTLTQGYPYFLQEWGYQTWNQADSSPITLEVVRHARPFITQRLDENFFRVRFDRLTPSEKLFLRGMAELGDEACRISDLADLLKVKLGSLSPRRAELIHKGMIYSPGHGDLDFTVPLFGEFMRRQIPQFPPE